MDSSLKPIDDRKTTLVARYFTPLAVLMVLNGIILGEPPSPAREIAIGLLVFSILFNFIGVRWVGSDSAPWKVTLRMFVNVGVNILLVYELGRTWPSIWLLLMLSPIAAAMYGSRSLTIGLSFFTAAVLVTIAWLHGVRSPIALAERGTYGLFVVLVSLAVYELARKLKDPTSAES